MADERVYSRNYLPSQLSSMTEIDFSGGTTGDYFEKVTFTYNSPGKSPVTSAQANSAVMYFAGSRSIAGFYLQSDTTNLYWGVTYGGSIHDMGVIITSKNISNYAPSSTPTWDQIKSLFAAHNITLGEGTISAKNGFYEK